MLRFFERRRTGADRYQVDIEMSGFVHFDIRTEYSMGSSVVRIPELAALAKEQGHQSLAIADPNLHGMIAFYTECRKHGIKPIIGMSFLAYVDQPLEPKRIVLLCSNEEGYKNLLQLVAKSQRNTESFGAVPFQSILEANSGLIAISGGQLGLIGAALLAERHDFAKQLAGSLKRNFGGRFYIELCRVGRHDEERYIAEAVNLAHDEELPLLATNEVCFLREGDFNIQKIRSCIKTGDRFDNPNRERDCEPTQYFRSGDEMLELFNDLPDAIENTAELARRCHQMVNLGQVYLPTIRLPSNTTVDQELEKRAKTGLEKHLSLCEGTSEKSYRQRLAYELETIQAMGFSGYFLIVQEIVEWAKSKGIPVGPGRGSGSASLVSFCIGITAIDPLEYDLLFERLLNPERVSLPDFDIDFCEERRGEVITHVADTYGQDSVGQIATYNTLAARAVIRDVARVLSKGYGWGDALAKLIPGAPGVTLDKAIEAVDQLRQRVAAEEDVAEVIELSKRLEGMIRSVGRHAGGLVIAPGSLQEYIPFYAESASGTAISQFDKDAVELAGLVKFDFLGLTTLTVIQRTLDTVNENRRKQGERLIEPSDIKLDDQETFKTIQDGRTLGMFQLESEGMRRIIRDLKPDCIEDIVALVALFRPGPLETGGVDRFIKGKHSEEIDYRHPRLEPVLRTTYGEMLYQEDVMNVSRAIAGFSLGQADIMRKAMGKKEPGTMARMRDEFIEGATANEVPAKLAGQLFDQMEKFSGYAFNKAHAAGYAILAFQTAWLKTHHTAPFFAAAMSSCMTETEKLRIYRNDMRESGIALLPPDVNSSEPRFHAFGPDRVGYALAAIKGVGLELSRAIVDERKSSGEFKSLYDFCVRVNHVGRSAMEALIKSGAMDALGELGETSEKIRPNLLAAESQTRLAAETATRQTRTSLNLFDETEAREIALEVSASAWTAKQTMDAQKSALGFRLIGHPTEDYADELPYLCNASVAQLKSKKSEKKNVTVLGVIESVRKRRDRNDKEYATLTVSDHTGSITAWAFADRWVACRESGAEGSLVRVKGDFTPNRGNPDGSLTVTRLTTLDESRYEHKARLVVEMDLEKLTGDRVEKVLSILDEGRGRGATPKLKLLRADWIVDLELGKSWRMNPTDEVVEQLTRELGAGCVRIEYPNQAS